MFHGKGHRFCAFLLMLGILLGVSTVPEDVSAYDYRDAREGTVAIVLYVTDGSIDVYDLNTDLSVGTLQTFQGMYAAGSGFFIGNTEENPQYLVTNEHVIDSYLNAGEGNGQIYEFIDYYEPETYDWNYIEVLVVNSCELRVYYSETDYDVAYVDCYGEQDKVDLAVLRLREPTDKRKALPIEVPTDQMVGAPVYSVGFPGNADNALTGASKYGVDDCTYHKGAISKFVANTGVGVERIATDAIIQHGNSGGPLITEQGNVVGVCANSWTEVVDEGTNVEQDYYAINSSELVRFLDKNRIPFQSAGKTGNKNLMMIIIIAAACAAAFVIILIIVLASSSKKKSKAAEQERARQEAVRQAQEQAAAAQAAAQAAAAAEAAQRAKTGTIRSLSPQHNGLSVPVGTTPVMIGRDIGSCKVIFKEGTPGISGKHCSVAFNPADNSFIVTDLRSSYGTFFLNGQKLEPNQPYAMHNGDSFYLASKEHTIHLEA